MAKLQKYRGLITVLLLAAAIGSYWLGMKQSMLVFIILGCSLELWFWYRLIGRR